MASQRALKGGQNGCLARASHAAFGKHPERGITTTPPGRPVGEYGKKGIRCGIAASLDIGSVAAKIFESTIRLDQLLTELIHAKNTKSLSHRTEAF